MHNDKMKLQQEDSLSELKGYEHSGDAYLRFQNHGGFVHLRASSPVYDGPLGFTSKCSTY